MAKTPASPAPEKAAASAAAPTPKKADKPPFVEDPSVREIYADDFVGMFGFGPNFHMTFAARRPASSGKGGLVRQTTARIVLPIDAMLELYNSLGAAVGHLATSGVIKAKEGKK